MSHFPEFWEAAGDLHCQGLYPLHIPDTVVSAEMLLLLDVPCVAVSCGSLAWTAPSELESEPSSHCWQGQQVKSLGGSAAMDLDHMTAWQSGP